MSKAEQEAKKSLGPIGWQLERNWREFRPRMVRELEAKGKLYQTLAKVAENVVEQKMLIFERLMEKGWDMGMAWLVAHDEALNQYLYPSEEELPKLGEKPER